MFDLLTHYGPKLLDGALMTAQLTFISVAIAGALSLPLAIVRRSKSWLCQAPIRLYVSFFRGTPLLAQLFLVYYGSGQFRPELTDLGLWWFFRDPFYCAIFTFALNSTAYQVEILRGGLQAVPYGEVEAAIAIGMPRGLLYRKVILPHTYRIAFPALGNEIILMLKGGAIASVITVLDLMGQTRRVFSQTFDISAYFWAAMIYLAITSAFVLVWRLLERRLTRHMRYQEDSSQATGSDDAKNHKAQAKSESMVAKLGEPTHVS